MPARILVVDGEPLKRITLQIELSERGYEVHEAADAEAARRVVDTRQVDVVISDVRTPATSGLDLLGYVKRVQPAAEVILMTACGTVDTAVLAMKRGAYDYITKPFTTSDLLLKLEQLLARREPAAGDEAVETFGGAVARSSNMKRLFGQLQHVAASDKTILLYGENGTGKQVLAEAIHQHSPRCERPLVRCGCAGMPAASLEGELFGRAKGALAEGARQKVGRLELARGGTLVLAEVEQVPLELQPRLLQLVQRQAVEPAGGGKPIRFDARLICTTNCDLLTLVKSGRFREDLYYRLHTLSFTLPPLRDRPDDIPVLARHFLRRHSAVGGDRPVAFAPAALDELARHTWPGNARELEHVVERALALCQGEQIGPEHVFLVGRAASETAALPLLELGVDGTGGLSAMMAEIERRLILMALRETRNNQARAARRLGIPRTTLRDKMAKYAITMREGA